MDLNFLRRFRTKGVVRKAKSWQASSEAAALALQERRFENAIQLYDEVIEHKCNHAEAFYKRANAYSGLGRWENALVDYDHAIALDTANAKAYCNRGAVLERLARWDEALTSYDRSIALNPSDFLSYYNRGSTLKQLERFDDALASYDRAIELKKDYADAFVNRGNILQKLRRYEAAVASYDRAIDLDAAVAEAYLGRGVSLFSLRRFREALTNYDHAITLRDSYVEAYSNRGGVLQELGQHEAALASYATAIKLNPSFAAAHHGNGFSLLRLQRFEAAIASYDKAIAIEADRKYLLGMRLHAQMQICDWTNLTSELKTLTEGLQAREPVSVPLPVLAVVDSPALDRSVAEIWVQNEYPSDTSLGPILPRKRSGKIRIGYFSSDFCEHAVSLVTAEVFELHDRSRFEITAFAFGPRPNDPMRARLQRAFDRFIDVRDRSDKEVALMARDLGIDLAVDLNGYTEFGRTNIFALRAAPIQINYLGYPGTMGAEYMDYLIADHTVVPEAQRRHYAEKIVYLPNSYLPHDSTSEIAAKKISRAELGLPEEGFVFCCFNNNYKIVPSIFSSWMRMLGRTDNSVLWLAQNDPVTARNLRREAVLRGVGAERLVFSSRVESRAQHLARLRCADLFLDTLPYNAHATATDALWAGLPLITLCGESFAARVGASLLAAIGLPELITSTPKQYEDLAVELATNGELMRDVKAKLLRNRLTAPLFDTGSFTTHLGSAYEMIFERYHAELPPDHIYVSE